MLLFCLVWILFCVYIDEKTHDGTEDNPIDEGEDGTAEHADNEVEEDLNQDPTAEQEDKERATARFDQLENFNHLWRLIRLVHVTLK
jgi:hypothetical protein